jgi:acid phosphatase family membrane protein YuiD
MKSGFGAIVAFFGAIVVVHVLKFLVFFVKARGRKPREVLTRALRSGGMPSGHSADMAAITTYLGLWQGFDSAIFALAVGVSVLIIYDAMNVRFAVGEIGKEVNRFSGKKMRIYEGHTLPQVVVGVGIGVGVGVLGFWIVG